MPDAGRPGWRAIAAAALLAAAVPAAADEALTVEGDIRLRVEWLGGQFRPGRAVDDSIQSIRTRVFVGYDAGPVRLGVELLDARSYGSAANTSLQAIDVNALEPIQIYGALDLETLGPGHSGLLKLGRVTLPIGSTRLVGRQGWPGSVNTYDGAVLDWTMPGKNRLIAFWTRPVARLPDDTASIRENRVRFDRSRPGLRFWGAHYTRAALRPGLSGEAYAFRLEEHDATGGLSRDRRLWTVGGRLRLAPRPGHWDFDIEAAHQSGTARATAAAADRRDLDVEAVYVHAEVGRLLRTAWTPRVSTMLDVATGDGGDPDRLGRFDPLFGQRRPELGPVSLFGPLTRANLVSAGLRIDAKPSKRTDLLTTWRANWLEERTDAFAATQVRDPAGRSGRFAGHQFELEVRHWLVPARLRIDGGAALLAKGRFLETAPNAPGSGNTRYAYSALTVAF